MDYHHLGDLQSTQTEIFVVAQFGGKLVSLENGPVNGQQPGGPRLVHVSQVVTETTFLTRSEQLQAMLSAGTFPEFCQEKIQTAQDQFEKTVWSFLKVTLGDLYANERVLILCECEWTDRCLNEKDR